MRKQAKEVVHVCIPKRKLLAFLCLANESQKKEKKKEIFPLIYYSSHPCLIIQRHEAKERKKKNF